MKGKHLRLEVLRRQVMSKLSVTDINAAAPETKMLHKIPSVQPMELGHDAVLKAEMLLGKSISTAAVAEQLAVSRAAIIAIGRPPRLRPLRAGVE